MATWVAVFRAAARDAAAAGRAMTPDSMGLLWPLLVPFVYLGLLALAVVGLAIFNAVRRARHNRSPGP
jgi:hypothetical protein